MKPQIMENLILIGGMVIYFAMVGAIVTLQGRRKKTRWPFKPADDRLLRGPGEDLKRRTATSDERLLFEVMGGIVLGLLCLAFVGDDLRRWFGWPTLPALVGGVAGAVAAFAASGWRISRLLNVRRNCHLGWFGERHVAEWLEPIKLAGRRMSHAVPAED